MEPLSRPGPPGGVEELVRAAQRGDPDALERLVRDLAPYVGRICGAIAAERGDDAVQETLMVVARKLGTLRDPGALRGWVRRIAVREALRASDPGRSVPVDPAELARVAPWPESIAVEIAEVLDGLAPTHRAVLVLRHVEGLSEHEIADVLDVAPGTVKSRLHRARATFRQRWSA